MKTSAACLVGAILLTAVTATGAKPDSSAIKAMLGNAVFMGAGTFSCGRVVEDYTNFQSRTDLSSWPMEMGWVEGFLSAENSDLGINLEAFTDRAGVDQWLLNYCRQHPVTTFLMAVISAIVGPLDMAGKIHDRQKTLGTKAHGRAR